MSNGRKTITTFAPAKINFFLEVLSRRDDGYHNLRSIVMPVSVYDLIEIELREGKNLLFDYSEKSTIPLEELQVARNGDNLAVKAAKEFLRETGISKGFRIRLEKHIPVGSGMGGGSADAAAVLHCLNMLCNAGFDIEKLRMIGAKLGSDIPALTHGGAALIEGKGEIVTPLNIAKESGENKRWWLVILYPHFHVSTKDIYSRHTLSLTHDDEKYKRIICSVEKGDIRGAVGNLKNDLQETVFRKYPVIKIILEKMREAGALDAMVSGSGSSVFGLANDKQHAEDVAERLRKVFGMSIWLRVAHTLPDGVMAAHGPLEA